MDTPNTPSSPAEPVADADRLHRIVAALSALGAAIPDCHTVSVATLPNYNGVAFHTDTEARAYALAEAFRIELTYSEPTEDRKRWLRGDGRLNETRVQVFGPHVDAAVAVPLDTVNVDKALDAATKAVRP